LSANLYAYCFNNPVINNDPKGYFVSPANIIGAVIGGILGAVGGYFLIKFLADKIGLNGWKRQVFIWGLTAVITASAATIGYFLGSYVARTGKALIQSFRKMILKEIKPSNCFTAGTLIKAKDGEIPIEDIKVGDYVYSEKAETGEKGYKEVLNVFVHETNEIIELQAGSESIETTEGHPFWVLDEGWVEAQNLVVGDRLVLYDESTVTIDSIRTVQKESPIKVYNFEVAEWHTYFITESNILFHNANCGNELQQLREAARKMGIKSEKEIQKLSKDLHKWKKSNGMKPGDHMSWSDLLEYIMDYLGM